MNPWLVFAVVLCQAFVLSEALASNCTGGCSCSELVGENGIHAKCTVTDLKELLKFIRHPLDVKSL